MRVLRAMRHTKRTWGTRQQESPGITGAYLCARYWDRTSNVHAYARSRGVQTCPTRACAWCGVGSVMAKRTAKPWTPATLHGYSGHLCPTCARYRDDGEPMGAALLDIADPDRALRRRSPLSPDVRDLRGWAQMPGRRPNAEPWEHVDLDGLRATLARADW